MTLIYTDETRRAMTIAYRAHQGQVDKAGTPYIFHPMHVAEQMATPEEVCVALLHDVLEDTDATADDLREAGMSEEVVAAVVALTFARGESRRDYIARIKELPLARAVKLEDLRHNADLTRLTSVTDRDLARARRYAAEIDYLEEA